VDFSPERVAERLNEGLQTGAFPGALAFWGAPGQAPRRVAVGCRGRSRNSVPVSFDLIYDLASVTKLLATASLAMILAQKGRLDLRLPLAEGPLGTGLPSLRTGSWSLITPEHLLAHQSGFQPWLPLHRLPNIAPERRKEAALAAIWQEAALEPTSPRPGLRTVYSDLNFILLGFLLEEIGGQSLDRLFEQEIAAPLGLSALGFRPKSGPLCPTEDGFRWGGPVGHPEAGFRGPTPLGRVHDDNAAWLGGVSGHAGLFGPAAEIWTLAADWGRAWSEGRGRLFQREVLADFIRPRPSLEDGGRPLGFNIKAQQAFLVGTGFSPVTVGHSGYTGPSLWWDPEQDFLWLFLSNRVHPRSVNPAWSPARYQAGPIP
jgi:CubicO group peptidase (beta-lactamase class C family)